MFFHRLHRLRHLLARLLFVNLYILTHLLLRLVNYHFDAVGQPLYLSFVCGVVFLLGRQNGYHADLGLIFTPNAPTLVISVDDRFVNHVCFELEPSLLFTVSGLVVLLCDDGDQQVQQNDDHGYCLIEIDE